MKKTHYLRHKDATITHWIDDFGIYRWDFALSKKFLVGMPTTEYKKLLAAFSDIASVVEFNVEED